MRPSKRGYRINGKLSHGDDVCLFALDETGIKLECSNFYGWAPKGLPFYAEANGSRKGVNVIGATEILKDYKPCYSIHPSLEGIRSQHVGQFVDKLMHKTPSRKVWVMWRPHCRSSLILKSYRPIGEVGTKGAFLQYYFSTVNRFDIRNNTTCPLITRSGVQVAGLSASSIDQAASEG